jgi:hypothetical protein
MRVWQEENRLEVVLPCRGTGIRFERFFLKAAPPGRDARKLRAD